MEAATGDKEFWVVDVVGNFCFVHPAKAGIASNLNLITDKGNIYSFTLQDVSDSLGRARLEGPGASLPISPRLLLLPGRRNLFLPLKSSNRASSSPQSRRTLRK